MEKLNEALSTLEMQLADTALYTDANKDKLKDLLQQQADLKTQLEETEMQWFDASEQLEAAQAAEE